MITISENVDLRTMKKIIEKIVWENWMECLSGSNESEITIFPKLRKFRKIYIADECINAKDRQLVGKNYENRQESGKNKEDRHWAGKNEDRHGAGKNSEDRLNTGKNDDNWQIAGNKRGPVEPGDTWLKNESSRSKMTKKIVLK